MAYTFYHPTGDPSNEIQLYVFEMPDALKALGKYGSEKPDEAVPVTIGDQGYTSAGSTLFYAGKYYTQIVSTQDDPKFAAFALEMAKRVVARQKPGGTQSPLRPGTDPLPPRPAEPEPAEHQRPSRPPAKPAAAEVSPATFFASCPPRSGRAIPSTSPRTSSAIASSPTSSWPITRTGTSPGRASSGPTATPRRPRRCSRNTSLASRKTAPRSRRPPAEGADEMVVSNNIGLVDFVFRKGNTLAGANGATSAAPAEAFARDGQEPARHRADDRGRQLAETLASTAVRDIEQDLTSPGPAGIHYPQPRSNDGRETDPDSAEEPGEVRRGEPGGPAVLPPAVRHAGRRLRAGGRRRRGRGLVLRDNWGMEGVKPPPPVRLKNYGVTLPVGRPSLVVVRSRPVRAEDHATKDDELKARKEQAFAMVKAAMDTMGGVAHFIQKGDVVVIKPNVAFDKNPDSPPRPSPIRFGRDGLCLGAGAHKVIVADNPINNPESCFYKTKVGEAAIRAGTS